MKNSHLDRRTQYSLQMIRSALFELLKEKDLRAITVTDICRIANVNRGTFYKYYQDVPDLFSKIEDALIEENFKIIEINCLENFDLEELFYQILTLVSKNQDFFAVAEKNALDSRSAKKILESFRPQFLETIISIMPEVSNEEVDIIFEFILGGSANLIISWVRGGMTTPLEKMQKILVRLIQTLTQGYH